VEVSSASPDQIDDLAVLFDQYRVFYRQPSDLEAARRFLQERFQNSDSVIFAATDNRHVVGFTQLYHSYSSVAMRRIWILNDLFVEESYRRKGVAKLLMDAAKSHAEATGAARITLTTQISNVPAQKLYESLGYIKDKEFYHYALRV